MVHMLALPMMNKFRHLFAARRPIGFERAPQMGIQTHKPQRIALCRSGCDLASRGSAWRLAIARARTRV
jgi:hypothetical protein